MKKCYPILLSIAVLGSYFSPVWALQAQSTNQKITYKDLIVDASKSQTFRALQIESESRALKYLDQAFRDRVSQVSLRVLGDRNGSISPILTISVSISEWRSEPKLPRWVKYYPVSNVLLGFNVPSQPTLSKPKVVNAPAKNESNPVNSQNIPSRAGVPGVAQPEVQDLQGFRDD